MLFLLDTGLILGVRGSEAGSNPLSGSHISIASAHNIRGNP
jgi:hypothetical protein